METLERVPEDIILKVMCYLDVKDILELSYVSSDLHDLCQQREIWIKLLKSFRAKNEPYVEWTDDFIYSDIGQHKQFFMNIVHRYHYLPGLWKRNLKHYRGLLMVKFRECGRIIGFDLKVSDLEQIIKPWFSIDVDMKHYCVSEITCDFFSTGKHGCNISVSGRQTSANSTIADEEGEMMYISCDSHSAHNHERISDYLRPHLSMPNSAIQRMFVKDNLLPLQKVVRSPPTVLNSGIVKPGYFFGNHWGKIMYLDFSEGELTLTRIMGDHNASGKVMIRVDLNHPVDYVAVIQKVLGGEQFCLTETLDRYKLEDADDSLKDVSKWHAMLREKGVNLVSDTYISAYRGKITLDHHHAQLFFVDILFVVFDEDSVGGLWFITDRDRDLVLSTIPLKYTRLKWL